jgi:hypothetical protein
MGTMRTIMKEGLILPIEIYVDTFRTSRPAAFISAPAMTIFLSRFSHSRYARSINRNAGPSCLNATVFFPNAGLISPHANDLSRPGFYFSPHATRSHPVRQGQLSERQGFLPGCIGLFPAWILFFIERHVLITERQGHLSERHHLPRTCGGLPDTFGEQSEVRHPRIFLRHPLKNLRHPLPETFGGLPDTFGEQSKVRHPRIFLRHPLKYLRHPFPETFGGLPDTFGE